MSSGEETPLAVEPAQRRARDGSPVDLYTLLPTEGEPELIHARVPPGASVLDLGCGVGRIAHALAALGHPVTAVDESPEMLAAVRGVETIQSRIEDLDLGRTFGCVLLMSDLVNSDGRGALLRTCRAHVAAGGRVLVERIDPGTSTGTWSGGYGPFDVEVDVERVGDAVRGIVAYALPDGRRWTHRFGPGAKVLDDDAMRAELDAAGLRLERFFGPKRRWCAARPA